jgi:succinate dehydrogenase hydrophobic membrane anchor protein
MKSCTSIYLIQRITAVLLIPLIIWCLNTFIPTLNPNFSNANKFLLLDKIYLSSFIIISLYHGYLGVKNIIIDYIKSLQLQKICNIVILTIVITSILFLIIFI